MQKALDLISDILNYFFGVDVPWQFRLLTVMVLLFFGGGLLLDCKASLIKLPEELTQGTHTAEYDKMLIDFKLEQHKAMSSSANLLYDFSKISLGALIASITQMTKKKNKINQE